MPLLIPCDELQAGMRLIGPFVWQDRTMLTADTVLTFSDINSLRERFPKQNFRIADPLLDAVVEFEDDSHERDVARTAQRKVGECMSEVQARFSARASLGGLSVTVIQSTVADVIRFLEENAVSAALVARFMGGEGYLSEHAGNVFYLSMLLGMAVRQYVVNERERQSKARCLESKMVENLTPLGLGAMLMDLGMMPLQHVFTEDKPLSPEIWQEIRHHPDAGAESLPEDLSPTAKMIVRTHHENMDGSGYPREIPGEKLHVFARIIRIADAYDAATATRVYKEAKSPVRALWEMSTGPYRRYYDHRLMSMFIQLIQPFPIGSKIRLEDGRFAVVVKYNRKDPIAPEVIVAFDARNQRLPNSQLEGPLQLGQRPDLRAASFGDEDVSFIYKGEPGKPHRCRVGVWPALFEAAYP